MSSEIEGIRQKLGQLSVEDLQAIKKLADNELKSRAIMEAGSFRAGERVRVPDGVIGPGTFDGTVEYVNRVTVAVKLDGAHDVTRVAPGKLERI